MYVTGQDGSLKLTNKKKNKQKSSAWKEEGTSLRCLHVYCHVNIYTLGRTWDRNMRNESKQEESLANVTPLFY